MENIKAFIVPNTHYTVIVQEYKQNTLRDDAYWVTKQVKTYKKEKDALKFLSRFS
jgi:hypothetical protein